MTQIVDNSDADVLERFVDDHVTGSRPLVSSRSRCIDGSTLLHAAVYFGRADLAARLLASSPVVDVAMTDYRGATPLHRARGAATIRLLLAERADTDARDVHGNTPLHVLCYGETSHPSDLDAVRALVIDGRARLDEVNAKGLTALHCAAMQGRVDVIEILVAADDEQTGDGCRQLSTRLTTMTDNKLPSPVYMSVVNDQLQCAIWLQTECPLTACSFRATEPSRLLRRLIAGKLTTTNEPEVARFLIENGGTDTTGRDVIDSGGRRTTLLHVAAERGPGSGPLVEVLVNHGGADIDELDADGQTPLHVACSRGGLDPTVAATLVRLGADWTRRRPSGERPFDLVDDLDAWIESGVFGDDDVVLDELKKSKLRQMRHLVRTITRKVRPPPSAADVENQHLIQRLVDIGQYSNMFSTRRNRK